MIGFRELALAGLIVAAPPAVALAQSPGVQAGEWEMLATVTALAVPNAPAAIVDSIKGRTKKTTRCLAPVDAARGPQDLLKGDSPCVYTRYSMAGGKLSAQMQCTRGASTASVVIDGSFTPDAFTTTSHTVSTGPMAMTMTSTATGRRTGACQK